MKASKDNKKKRKYLPLAKVTNMYSQFGQLSPKDKAKVNRQFEIKMQIKNICKLLRD